MTTRQRILDAAERLVQERGFAGTSVDAVIAETPTSKGSFFHHFGSKTELGRELVRRYAEADAAVLEEFLCAAEAETDDPAEQVVAFVRRFEEAATDLAVQQPGCLFVSFLYARGQVDRETSELIRGSIDLWRERLLARLRMAARLHPPVLEVDLPSLADQVFTTFEGGFVLARATDDPAHLAAQLRQLRHYLTLLFGLDG